MRWTFFFIYMYTFQKLYSPVGQFLLRDVDYLVAQLGSSRMMRHNYHRAIMCVFGKAGEEKFLGGSVERRRGLVHNNYSAVTQ